MKKIILAFLILLSTNISAQTYLMGGLDPFQPGFRLDAGQIFNRSVLYGYTQLSEIFIENFDASHAKIGIGYGYEFYPEGFLTAGVNYNKYYNVVDNSDEIDLNNIKDISIDLGITVYIQGKKRTFMSGAKTDILNWETAISFGWIIGSKNNKHNENCYNW